LFTQATTKRLLAKNRKTKVAKTGTTTTIRNFEFCLLKENLKGNLILRFLKIGMIFLGTLIFIN
jgi:hypothetical protein